MFENVEKILTRQLKLDKKGIKVTPESSIKGDLGADSLDILQLLLTIEDEYGVTIPDEELAKFVLVSDIVDYLEALK